MEDREDRYNNEDDYYGSYPDDVPVGYILCGNCGNTVIPMKENGECPECWRKYHDW